VVGQRTLLLAAVENPSTVNATVVANTALKSVANAFGGRVFE